MSTKKEISVHSGEEGGNREESGALPVRAHPQETPGYGGETNVRLPDENPTRAASPCSAHQINFTLAHLPATVMSFIHPFPPVAMATLPLRATHSFTFVFLPFFLHPSPSPDPSEPSPLTPSERYSYTPQSHKHPPLSPPLSH